MQSSADGARGTLRELNSCLHDIHAGAVWTQLGRRIGATLTRFLPNLPRGEKDCPNSVPWGGGDVIRYNAKEFNFFMRSSLMDWGTMFYTKKAYLQEFSVCKIIKTAKK